mmetsp:Transcript_30635/g.49587  ORF Transcript_30635/g.49587 Transcript_30635/m.49587 type:complete len:441 (-) Transcript_30635:207-1529(-)
MIAHEVVTARRLFTKYWKSLLVGGIVGVCSVFFIFSGDGGFPSADEAFLVEDSTFVASVRGLLNGKHCEARLNSQPLPSVIHVNEKEAPIYIDKKGHVVLMKLPGKNAVPFNRWHFPCYQPDNRSVSIQTTGQYAQEVNFSPISDVCPSYRSLMRLLEEVLSEKNILLSGSLKTVDAFYDKLRGFTKRKVCGNSQGEEEEDVSSCMKFEWGHDIKIGPLQVNGYLSTMHLHLMSMFIDYFGFPRKISDANVLDIGSVSGASSYLYAAMGARKVVVVEDQPVTRELIDFVGSSLRGLKGKIFTIQDSYYHLPLLYPKMMEHFDVVGHWGHNTTDHIMGLWVAYSLLKPGGYLLLETRGTNIDRYHDGAEYFSSSSRGAKANWWRPHPSTVGKMLEDAGFVNIRVTGTQSSPHYPDHRVLAIAQRGTERKTYVHHGFPFHPC